jgi:GDP-mannose transporter
MGANDVIQSVLAYSLVSSLMLITNKVCLHLIPMPSLVTCIQLATCSAIIIGLKVSGTVEVDDYSMDKVRPYLLYIMAFVGGVYCNMQALQHANVETVVVFRTCAPLVVSLLDWWFLNRMLPSGRSLAGLLLIIFGAVGYVSSDRQFGVQGWMAYTWVSAYLIIICFEMTYGKYIIQEVKMKNRVWGAVYYTNTLAVLPMFLLGFGVFGEGARFGSFEWTPAGCGALALSCVLGTAISWAGFNCRNNISATSFTVVGVMNKMLTVLVNCLIWDRHASGQGLMYLFLCIAGGVVYKQAPLRPEAKEALELVKSSAPSLPPSLHNSPRELTADSAQGARAADAVVMQALLAPSDAQRQ